MRLWSSVEVKKSLGYRAPEPETNEEFGTEEMIVEVRDNRLCTVLPGSVHVSGEAIAFDDRHDNCPVVDVELFKACLSGPRHELVLCTGAKLAWLGWSTTMHAFSSKQSPLRQNEELDDSF